MAAGYLGVNIGQPMAYRLLDAGHGLTICDVNEAAMTPPCTNSCAADQ
jgi:3-hydroxyisobutyrate dehydrogenase-like beta-hydroxyacid dehydrogenase